jgi:hypothetical protein
MHAEKYKKKAGTETVQNFLELMTKIEKSIHFSSEKKTQNKYQGNVNINRCATRQGGA